MNACLLFGRHRWMPWFLSGTGEWMRGCTKCPEVQTWDGPPVTPPTTDNEPATEAGRAAVGEFAAHGSRIRAAVLAIEQEAAERAATASAWDWCGEKAPGLDNGMFDVVCSLRRKHRGDEHRLEAGGRVVARWPATPQPGEPE